MTEKVKIIEKLEGVIAYDCDKVYYVRLQKGAVLSDHSHNHKETVFLMEGEAEAIIGEKTQIVKAPAKLVIPSNIYHKFTALTDLIGLEIK
ncbi:MAG: cupin domain-containing protein [Candidatus Nomurabacteria bacterium]|nr:cupin domain-containing protein [Candidatus Nomurabacteria bacterium]